MDTDNTAPLDRALAHLAAGRWQDAHTIVQEEKSTMGSWLHGIVHILEGDLKNARGWYERAERAFPDPPDATVEIEAARTALGRVAGR
jgi:hypothetical protein